MYPKKEPAKIIAAITLLSLILFVLFLPLIQAADSPQKDKENSKFLASTLRTANQSINKTIFDLRNQGITIPQSTLKILDEAKNAYNQATNLINENKYTQASTLLLQTLQKIRNAINLLNTLSNQTPDEGSKEKTIQDTLDRNYLDLLRLQNLAVTLSKNGFDTKEITAKLAAIKDSIDSASSAFNKKDYEQAKIEIIKVQTQLNELTCYFSNLANAINLQRVQTYIASAEQNLVSLQQQINSPTSNLNSTAIAAATATITQAQTSLDKAKQYLDNQQIAQTLNELSTVQTSRQTVSNIIDAAKAPTPTPTPTIQVKPTATPASNSSTTNSTRNTSSAVK